MLELQTIFIRNGNASMYHKPGNTLFFCAIY